MAGRRTRTLRRRAGKQLVRWCGPFALRALADTWRQEILGGENLARAERLGGRIMALWHGRMLVGMPHHRERSYSVLVSPSDDGDISKLLLEANGYRVIRGSTSRGGARAMREMLSVLETKGVIVITPDGPRGPRHSMNQGLAWMSSVTGYPIVPCGFVCDRGWRMNSWDRFVVPKPRARVVLSYGEPLIVRGDCSESDLLRAGRKLRAGILRAERLCFERLGLEPDW